MHAIFSSWLKFFKRTLTMERGKDKLLLCITPGGGNTVTKDRAGVMKVHCFLVLPLEPGAPISLQGEMGEIRCV